MEQPTNKSSRAISLSLAAGLVITLFITGTLQPVERANQHVVGIGRTRKKHNWHR